jgi:hypothetical protein
MGQRTGSKRRPGGGVLEYLQVPSFQQHLCPMLEAGIRIKLEFPETRMVGFGGCIVVEGSFVLFAPIPEGREEGQNAPSTRHSLREVASHE